MTELLPKLVQVRARAHHVADTFVADGRNGDLLFCFIALWLRTRALCTCDADKAFSMPRALSAHGGFPDQAAL